LLIASILLVMFGKLPDYTKGYTITATFTDAGGVMKDTPIRKSGILIGRVTGVRLIDDDSKVLVTMSIYSDKRLYKNEECRIVRNLLSGDTALVFAPVAGRPGAGQLLDPDAALVGANTGDPSDLMKEFKNELKAPIETISNTARSLGDAADQLGRAAKRVEITLDDPTVANIQKSFARAAQSLDSLQEILGDEKNRAKLTDALQKLPKTIDNVSSTFESAESALRKFTEPDGKDQKSPIDRIINTAKLAEQTMKTFNDPSPDGGPPPTQQMAKAISNINEVTNLLKAAMDHLENGDGTVGKLMKDPQLYDRLNRVAKNLEDISWKLQPIVDDARVITDKMARHPGVIIRDAVRPGVGIK
jgi:phospholipid/cholesterol/gamma-HCH transport system substrate-binding protein